MATNNRTTAVKFLNSKNIVKYAIKLGYATSELENMSDDKASHIFMEIKEDMIRGLGGR